MKTINDKYKVKGKILNDRFFYRSMNDKFSSSAEIINDKYRKSSFSEKKDLVNVSSKELSDSVKDKYSDIPIEIEKPVGDYEPFSGSFEARDNFPKKSLDNPFLVYSDIALSDFDKSIDMKVKHSDVGFNYDENESVFSNLGKKIKNYIVGSFDGYRDKNLVPKDLETGVLVDDKVYQKVGSSLDYFTESSVYEPRKKVLKKLDKKKDAASEKLLDDIFESNFQKFGKSLSIFGRFKNYIVNCFDGYRDKELMPEVDKYPEIPVSIVKPVSH